MKSNQLGLVIKESLLERRDHMRISRSIRKRHAPPLTKVKYEIIMRWGLLKPQRRGTR